MIDVLAHLRRRERWRWREIAFWLALLAAILMIPLARGARQRGADRRPVRAVARSDPRARRRRLARPRGVLRPRRLYRGDPRQRRLRRSLARPAAAIVPCALVGARHRAAAAARRRSDPADGDDGRRADARRTRQRERRADRRRRRPQLHRRAAVWPFLHRLHRRGPAQRRAVHARRAVPAVRRRASATRLAVRRVAGGGAREPAARRRARRLDLAPAHRDLRALGRLCRRSPARCSPRPRRSPRSTCSISTAPPM